VKKTIERNYLEIKSLGDLIENNTSRLECSINLVKPDDFQINKFFYKNVGKKHRWTDRLVWSDKEWIKYSSNLKVDTYILKVSTDLPSIMVLEIIEKNLLIDMQQTKASVLTVCSCQLMLIIF